MGETWQSQRKVEEDITNYRRKRFEEVMELSDIGLLSRLEAIAQCEKEQAVELDLE